MLRTIIASFVLAFHNIRSHFFHTILSVLGIVIGVAALVAILSLIDGMEQYAKNQITQTTSLKTITINSILNKNIDGVSFRKDSVDVIDYQDYLSLESALTHPATGQLFVSSNREVMLVGDSNSVGTYTSALLHVDTTQVLLHGRKFTRADQLPAAHVAVINETLAKSLLRSDDPGAALNKKVVVRKDTLTIAGIVRSEQPNQSVLFMPIGLISAEELKTSPPMCRFEAQEIEDVPALKTEIDRWITKRFGGTEDFRVFTYEGRVDQAVKGFTLFRIVMGLIVGISVLVGGIGVMNVLLISVTERTVEIGIRKAVGANRKDITLQFLSESVTISLVGSFFGLVCGVLGTMIAIPIIRSLTQMPFEASYTWNTLMVVAIVALIVGIVFGTYPAMRAARLDPVDAIRRE